MILSTCLQPGPLSGPSRTWAVTSPVEVRAAEETRTRSTWFQVQLIKAGWVGQIKAHMLLKLQLCLHIITAFFISPGLFWCLLHVYYGVYYRRPASCPPPCDVTNPLPPSTSTYLSSPSAASFFSSSSSTDVAPSVFTQKERRGAAARRRAGPVLPSAAGTEPKQQRRGGGGGAGDQLFCLQAGNGRFSGATSNNSFRTVENLKCNISSWWREGRKTCVS